VRHPDCRLVAHHVGAEIHPGRPRVSAELPESGERFEGLVPPVVTAPCFAIRRPAVAVFTLDHYREAGIMSARQAQLLRAAIRERRNVLTAGGTWVFPIAGRRARSVSTRPTPPRSSGASAANGSPSASRSWRS
jgi:hypothetical protein